MPKKNMYDDFIKDFPVKIKRRERFMCDKSLIDKFIYDRQLCFSGLKILLYFMKFRSNYYGVHLVYPMQATIKNDLNMPYGTVSKAISVLKELKYVHVIKYNTMKWKRNLYVIVPLIPVDKKIEYIEKLANYYRFDKEALNKTIEEFHARFKTNG